QRFEQVLSRVVDVAKRRATTVLAVCALWLVGFGFAWATLLRVDTDWLESWGERSDRTRAIRFLEERLGRLKTLQLQLSRPSDTAMEDPGPLAVVQTLEDSLARLDGVSATRSALALVVRANRLLHRDDPAFERVPATAGATAEILELLGQG